MALQKKVVDASIVIKWFLDEDDSAAARQLRQSHLQGEILLVVPELLFVEVLNALRYKGGTEKSIAAANKVLWDTQFHIEKINSFLLEKASTLALQYQLSVYDALYLALSTAYGCPLITADASLLKTPSALSL